LKYQKIITAIAIIAMSMFRLEVQADEILKRSAKDEAIQFAQGIVIDPMRFYCPGGPQERYINTVANSIEHTKIPVILCTFANGVGKTTTTIQILFNLIFGPQNGWFDYPIFRSFPFPKNIWYVSTAEALRMTIQPIITDLLASKYNPARRYQEFKDGRSLISRMVIEKEGWQISFKTFDQDPKTFEAANVGVIVLDEPAPEAIWKAIKSRRRMGCITLLPMTPLDCPPYIFDEIAKAAKQGRKGYYHLEASVYEACKKRGIRGHLDPDIVDAMVADYDPDELQARAYGKPMYYSRLIFYELAQHLHYVEPIEYPIPSHSRILHIVDPHDARPSAAAWIAQTSNGRYIVFDEYPTDKSSHYWEMKKGLDTKQEVEAWIKIEERHKKEGLYPPNTRIVRILDRHFGWQTRGGKTFAQQYLEAGRALGKNFNFQSSYSAQDEHKEVEFGHREVRRAIKQLEDGRPGVIVHKNCYHTWQGLTHYIRRKLTGKTADDRAESDGVIVEKYKDFPDLLRYAVCADITTTVPRKSESHAERIRREALEPARSEFTI
jgi:hypothetical protein